MRTSRPYPRGHIHVIRRGFPAAAVFEFARTCCCTSLRPSKTYRDALAVRCSGLAEGSDLQGKLVVELAYCAVGLADGVIEFD